MCVLISSMVKFSWGRVIWVPHFPLIPSSTHPPTHSSILNLPTNPPIPPTQHIYLLTHPSTHPPNISVYSLNHPYTHLSTHLSICPSIHSPNSQLAYSPIYPPTYPLTYPSSCPSIYPSFYLYIHLSIQLLIDLSTHSHV